MHENPTHTPAQEDCKTDRAFSFCLSAMTRSGRGPWTRSSARSATWWPLRTVCDGCRLLGSSTGSIASCGRPVRRSWPTRSGPRHNGRHVAGVGVAPRAKSIPDGRSGLSHRQADRV
jgi:hypothetical protein